MFPLYLNTLARRAWQNPRVRRFAYTYLIALVVLALLQGCGGGDPEPEPEAACLDMHTTEPVRIGTGRHGHDVKVPTEPCGEVRR